MLGLLCCRRAAFAAATAAAARRLAALVVQISRTGAWPLGELRRARRRLEEVGAAPTARGELRKDA